MRIFRMCIIGIGIEGWAHRKKVFWQRPTSNSEASAFRL
jgi:hypothetical protein